MCLGIPGQVVSYVEGYENQLALVDVVGSQRRVNMGMLEGPNVPAGQWVLLHMGFAVERIDAEGAAKALAGLKMMGNDPDEVTL